MEIRTVTVVGANGIMGTNISAIFASFGNAKVYMISRDIEASQKAAQRAAKSVRAEAILTNLIPADYSMLVECVEKSDLVFESVVENIDIKINITKQIARYLPKGAIACSGTSGLSITALAECFTDENRKNYFGVHMFNPPYNMTLCELITTKYSDNKIKKKLIDYLKNKLYRTVVETRDTPAFLANRIGFQFINQAMQYAERYKDNGGVDYIDAILGSFSGRTMAPLVTADFVGLDVHKAIVDNIYNNSCDYATNTFMLPIFVQKLIGENKLGRKSGEGLYKTERYVSGEKHLMVYDINSNTYRDKNNYIFPFALEMKNYIRVGDYRQAMNVLVNNKSLEAEICLEFLLNYILYSFVTAEEVAFDIQAADAAMASGFNWCPPLAMLEAFSTVADVKLLIKERIKYVDVTNVDVDRFMKNVLKSSYDYRVFFKSSE